MKILKLVPLSGDNWDLLLKFGTFSWIASQAFETMQQCLSLSMLMQDFKQGFQIILGLNYSPMCFLDFA